MVKDDDREIGERDRLSDKKDLNRKSDDKSKLYLSLLPSFSRAEHCGPVITLTTLIW